MAEEIPFDPHSVATAQTIEEQKQAEELRELFAKGNKLSTDTRTAAERLAEAEEGLGFITNAFGAKPENSEAEHSPLLEGTPKELREKLGNLIDKFTA